MVAGAIGIDIRFQETLQGNRIAVAVAVEVDNIQPEADRQLIAARAAGNPVVANAAIDRIGSVAANQIIVAAAATEDVVSVAALQRILAGPALQVILAARTEEPVVAVAAIEDVVTGGLVGRAVQPAEQFVVAAAARYGVVTVGPDNYLVAVRPREIVVSVRSDDQRAVYRHRNAGRRRRLRNFEDAGAASGEFEIAIR